MAVGETVTRAPSDSPPSPGATPVPESSAKTPVSSFDPEKVPVDKLRRAAMWGEKDHDLEALGQALSQAECVCAFREAYLGKPDPKAEALNEMDLGGVPEAFGVILALPALRVTGPYLAMVTLAFGTIVQILINEMTFLTEGPLGIPWPMRARCGRAANRTCRSAASES